MKQQKQKYLALVIILLLLGVSTGAFMSMYYIEVPQNKTADIVFPFKGFSPSTLTYENKTMYFETGDPYNGFSHWTYAYGGGTQGPSDGYYIIDTDSGEYQYFGYDEFVNHSLITTEVIFRPTGISGTYKFQIIGYFYQKTALESNTHWALLIEWTSSGLTLYHNTANGGTPSTTNLVATAPVDSHFYRCVLKNSGESSFVGIYDITPASEATIYNGNVTTISYDARSLYAGFGEYCTSGVNTWGRWDNYTIADTILSYPEEGSGFSVVGAYIDDVFTHTFYDIDTGFDSILSVSTSVSNITLLINCWLNGTYYNISSPTEGKNIIRHNVTVTVTNKTVVFSQSNFTYLDGLDYGDNLFWYEYSIELDITPLVQGAIYTTIITMEVYYSESEFTVFASSGSAVGEHTAGSYLSTYTVNGVGYEVWDENAPFLAIAYLNFIFPRDIEELSINTYGFCNPADNGTLAIWNGSDWETFATFGPFAYQWVNVTANSSYVFDSILSYRVNITQDQYVSIDLDYVEIVCTFSEQWHNIETMDVYFIISLSQETLWALNNFYILFGMGLVIFSGLYLVKGKRDELSMDKVFYFILAFLIGWGLIIGGVMP